MIALRTRVVNCFEYDFIYTVNRWGAYKVSNRAAALATACKLKIKFFDGYYDVRENTALGGPIVDFEVQWRFSCSHGDCRR